MGLSALIMADEAFQLSGMTPAHEKSSIAKKGLRGRVYELLYSDLWASRAIAHTVIAIIVVNLAAVCAESVPSLASNWRPLFTAIELVTFAIFSLEYGLRLWVAAEFAPAASLALRAPGSNSF
jgi:hypothetical protein